MALPHDPPSRRPASDRMHPAIYLSMLALLLLYILSVWFLFGGDYYNDLIFTIVTGLFVVASAIPALLWLTWRRNSSDDAMDDRTFRDWAAGEFETWTGKSNGINSAVEALLPIAAVAVGLTVLGVIFDVVVHHAA